MHLLLVLHQPMENAVPEKMQIYFHEAKVYRNEHQGYTEIAVYKKIIWFAFVRSSSILVACSMVKKLREAE